MRVAFFACWRVREEEKVKLCEWYGRLEEGMEVHGVSWGDLGTDHGGVSLEGG